MTKYFLIAVIIVLFSPALLAGATIHCQSPRTDLPIGVKKALQSTVSVYSVVVTGSVGNDTNKKVFSSVSSGFIADTNGHVVMSGHRIASFLQSKEMSVIHTVVLSDCRALSATVTVVGGDNNWGVDAVLIKIDHPPNDLIPIQRGASAVDVTGVKVYVLGSPFGWSNTVYDGVVAGSHLNDEQSEVLLAHINLQMGISGGALVTEDGVMVGVAQARGYVNIGELGIPVSIFVPVDKINEFLSKNQL